MLSIWLKSPLHLVDNRNRAVALPLLGDGKRGEAACSGAPACQRQWNVVAVCRQTDE